MNNQGFSPSWNRRNAAFDTLEHCRQALRDTLLDTRSTRMPNPETTLADITEAMRKIQISIDMHWENVAREAEKKLEGN